MFLRTVELAFARFQARRDPRALAIVFDRTASELFALARHLASAEADAEDLVQATFLQAIEAADSHVRGLPVLPWLLGILANQARSARRRARRSVDQARVRGDVVADVLTEVATAELGAELQQAIARLPEVYRPVLRMALEHGLEAQEIARTLERPAGTVRAQLSRGLELLRRALPRGVASGAAVAVGIGAGGRPGIAAVRSRVLAACPGTSTGIASTLLLGGLLVLHHKLLAAGAAVALALLGWSLFSGGAPAAPSSTGGEGRTVAAATASLPAPGAPDGDVARRDVAAAPDAAAPAPTAPPVADAATGELDVELVDGEGGAPLPGIGVAVQHGDDIYTFSRQSHYVTTDAHGIARFPALRPATWHIDVDRIGMVAIGEVTAGAVARRRFEVPAGIVVTGTVVDDRGQPVAGAAIAVHGSRLAAPTIAVTDGAGHFRASHLVANLELQARRPGAMPSPTERIAGAPGSTVEIVLRLGPAARRLAGRALAADGAPIAQATVAVVDAVALQVGFWDRAQAQHRPLYLTVDGDGRFATDEAGQGRLLVLVQPRDEHAAPCWEFVEPTPGDAWVELRAAPHAGVVGRALQDGRPVAGITVQAMDTTGNEIGFLANLVSVRVATTGADGAYRLDGLRPGRYQLIARHAITTVGETALQLAAGVPVQWDVDLSAGAAKPLRIEVHAAAALPQPLVVFVTQHDKDGGAPSMMQLGADGIAVFPGRRDGAVDVTVALLPGALIKISNALGRSLLQLARRDNVAAAEDTVVFELAAGDLPLRHVRGRLVDAGGAPLAGQALAVRRVDESGLAVFVELMTDADGAFESIALPAGRYQFVLDAFTAPRKIGTALVTLDRDEDVGALQVAK